MKIEKNCAVTFEYTLKDSSGTVIDDSRDYGPFFYIHGVEEILPGMEEVLDGKEEGFQYEGIIPCEKAYGEKSDEFHIPVAKAEFKNLDKLKAGMTLLIDNNYGEKQEMEIISIDDENVIIDANSPYAGMDIGFTCKVLEVRKATEEELEEVNHIHDHDCDCGDH